MCEIWLAPSRKRLMGHKT